MNNLKRLIFYILSVLMVFSLIACSSSSKETEEIEQEIITEETDFYRNILVAEFKGISNITRKQVIILKFTKAFPSTMVMMLR